MRFPAVLPAAVKARLLPFVSIISMASALLFSCSGKKEEVAPMVPQRESARPSAEVMMQAFYWDVPAGGTWWDNLRAKMEPWQQAGITTVWLPPVSKGQSGPYSMGYDPFDYFDFGQFNQHGTVETRFGSETELRALLSKAKENNIRLIADIVLNHNSGGDGERNPFTNGNTWTLYQPASGKFNRSAKDFHPNAIHAADAGYFGGFADLCHEVQHVKGWLWNKPESVARYYKNELGFAGWRFDYVKGFDPQVVKSWNAAVGGVAIGEYWDANVELVYKWCLDANSGAFDFPLYYVMKRAFNENMLYELEGKGLVSKDPALAYTFVANHDTDEIAAANKLKAYAYILTSEGTPFIFYKDYESPDKDKLNTLIWIRKNLAAGSSTRLYASASEYVFRRNGTPGLVCYLNNGPTVKKRTVQTLWPNTVLQDFTGANPEVHTDANGQATISCQASSYAVYAPR